MFCNHCGNEIDEYTVFCPKCGTKVKRSVIKRLLVIGLSLIALFILSLFAIAKHMTKGGSSNTAIPIPEEYKTQREEIEWYTSLDQVRTQTSDPISSSVSVQVVLGYKKGDKQASTEISARRIEILYYLRSYFSSKTAEELKPEREDEIKIEIRDGINDNILSNSKIRSVMFTAKDVVSQ